MLQRFARIPTVSRQIAHEARTVRWESFRFGLEMTMYFNDRPEKSFATEIVESIETAEAPLPIEIGLSIGKALPIARLTSREPYRIPANRGIELLRH